MKNIFDIIDYKFFQVFAGDNRRINAEIIVVISDYFKRNHETYVDKEDLVNYLSDYINNHNYYNIIDDEGNDITSSSAREKALNKINLFKRTGWLVEEDGENYTTKLQFDDNALIMIKAFEDISNNSTPKEYTGYLYVIDNLLRYFDYSQGISILEQAYENTEILMNRLRGLNTNIKKYLTSLLNDNDEDAEKLLRILLGEYQENVVSKAFSNLKLNDNPNKYKNNILNKLIELQSKESMTKLIENYRLTKLTEEDDELIEVKLVNQINYIYDNIESLKEIINLIDTRNSRYVKSSNAKLKFILNENFDVIGKIENLLKLMKDVDDDNIYDQVFSLYRMETIDPESMYKPRVYHEKIEEIDVEKPIKIDESYVNEVKANLFRDNRFSKKTINDYVKKILEDNIKIKASSIGLNNYDDLTRLILINLYAHHDNMCYKTELITPEITLNDIEFYDYWIIKRGDKLGG